MTATSTYFSNFDTFLRQCFPTADPDKLMPWRKRERALGLSCGRIDDDESSDAPAAKKAAPAPAAAADTTKATLRYERYRRDQ